MAGYYDPFGYGADAGPNVWNAVPNVDPTQTGSLPPGPLAGTGVAHGPLSGSGGGFLSGLRGLLDPQYALPIAAQLIGGATPQASFAGALGAAGPAIGDMRKRTAINAYLKSQSGLNLTPEEQQLLQNDPELVRSLVANRLTPHREWKQIGTGPYGNATYGWVDSSSGAVTPAGGGTTGSDQVVAPVSFGPDGLPDPAAQANFLKGLDPGVGSLVKQIADYKLDPSKATSLKGGSRERILALVSQYDPSYDATQFGVRNKMRLNMEAGGMYGQAVDALNQSIKHLGSMANNFEGLHNTSYPTWNAIANTAAYQTGNEGYQKAAGAFTQDADAIAGEVAKVFKGAGSTAEAEIKNWRAGLSIDMPPAAFKASVNELISHLLKARLDNIRSDYQAAMHKPMEFDPIRPETKAVLQKLGIDPGQLDDAATPQGAADASAGGGSGGGGDPLGEARAAIAAGAPRDAVIKRLQDNGIDASRL